MTLGELWDGIHRGLRQPGIYVLRHGARDVFYVGKSVDPIRRVRHHIQQFSPVGQLIRHNDPECWDWTVDIYEPEEWSVQGLNAAEREAILALGPALNCCHNDNGRRLRIRYDKDRRDFTGHNWDLRCGRKPRYSMLAEIRRQMRGW